jgi:hypothetical protein
MKTTIAAFILATALSVCIVAVIPSRYSLTVLFFLAGMQVYQISRAIVRAMVSNAS